MNEVVAVLGVSSALLWATVAQGDEDITHLRLPNEGRECFIVSSFEEGKTCGDRAYELWTCLEGEVGYKKPKNYLIVGEYVSDVGDGCSPTFATVKVIPQNKNLAY